MGVLSKSDTCTHLERFLNKVSEKRFFWFPCSQEASSKRKARDLKIIEKSIARNPQFLTKTNTINVFKDGLSLRAVRDQLLPEHKKFDVDSVSDEVWAQTEYDKDDVFLKLTGDGDQFTLPVACSEFVSKHYLFFTVLASVLIFVSTPFYELLKDSVLQFFYAQS